MISNITSLNEANKIIVDRLKLNNPRFLPLDKYTHHCLSSDRIDFLKTASGVEYDEFIRNYIDILGEAHDLTTYSFNGFSISSSDSKKYIVYPYSRTSLYKDVYADVLPSIFSIYFNIMKRMEKVRQFGTGVGKALIIETSSFTKSEFDSIRVMQYKDVVDLMVVVGEQIAKQNTDVEYLLSRIEELNKEKTQLGFEVDRLTQLVLNTSMTTWR